MLSLTDNFKKMLELIFSSTLIIFMARLVKKLFLKFTVKKSLIQSDRDERELTSKVAEVESEWLRVGRESDKIK